MLNKIFNIFLLTIIFHGKFFNYKKETLKDKSENNRAFLRNKKAPLENKRTILGIKVHFWKVKEHTDLGKRALAISPSPSSPPSGVVIL